MADTKQLIKEVALKGKLITAQDPAAIADNFQTLTNMRYWGNSIRSIAGMSKINTTIMNATYYQARRGIHYRKSQPSESHLIVQAFNSDLSSSRILQNKTAIPLAGEFESTSLFTPSSATPGIFTTGPKGTVVYANGEDVCVYGGDEFEVGAFYNYDPDDTFSYDYTDRVRNTLTDTENIAVLNKGGSVGGDTNTALLLHLDNNAADSSPSGHTVTNTGVTFSDSDYVFPSHSAVFAGSTTYLSVADHADFDFSDGTFTVDFRVKLDSLGATIYYQETAGTGNDWCKLEIDSSGAVIFTITEDNAGSPNTLVSLSTDTGLISTGTWYHIELAENDDSFYIFIDGVISAYASDTDRCADYTGTVKIGSDMTGKLDEFRVSKIARHTSDFEPPSEEYDDSSSSSDSVYMYLGSIVPISGFKPYIYSANTTSGYISVYYWNGSSWTKDSSVTDGTSSGGKTFSQTGTVELSVATSSHKVRYLKGMALYWYKIYISAASSNVSVSYMTIKTSFQALKDIWDGVPRPIDSFQVYKSGKYNDHTLDVRENTYTSNDYGTWIELNDLVELDDLPTSGSLIYGFQEPVMGISHSFVGGKVNTTSGTIASVDYWDGSSWTTVGSITDGTLSSGVSFAQNGVISWNAVAIESQILKDINNSIPFYFYRIKFTKQLSSDIQLYYVTGIPMQKTISKYSYPLFAHNRIWLLDDTKEHRNRAICSAENAPVTFNGEDSTYFDFGDDTPLTGGAWLYSQYGSSLYNVTIFFKASSTWAIVGDDPSSWVKYRISGTVGCVAPDTIKVVDLMGIQQSPTVRNIVIWQGADGIYASDGRTPICLSNDIKDRFDKNSSNCINQSYIDASSSGWDNFNQEYHWMYCSSSSSSPDKELVYSFKKNAWFEIDRGSSLRLQSIAETYDTDDNQYNYGLTNSGYIYRLENGTSFDGNAITSTFQFGDIAIAGGSVMFETEIQYCHIVAIAKSSVISITGTHYSDGATTGTSFSLSSQKSNYRLLIPVQHQSFGPAVFHSLKFSASNSSEYPVFEPLFVGMIFTTKRNHTRDWRS